MEPCLLIHWHLCPPEWHFQASLLQHSQGFSVAQEPTLAMTPFYAGWQEHAMQVATSNYREGFFPGVFN